MRVLVYSPVPAIALTISVACGLADIECEIEPSQQEFGSKLFRDPDAVGVFWAMGPASAAEVCRRLRMAEVRNVLFATIEDAGNKAPVGRALALNAGIDDIQPWPIDDAELIARLFALHRRRRDGDPAMIQLPGCTLHVPTGELVGAAARVHLTKQEAALLTALAVRPGMVMSKALCMLALYNGHSEPEIKIIDVYICKLRKKITTATGGFDVIETVWGQGYRFIAEGYPPAYSELGQRLQR
jgi:two-component system cell cycle response regulator CtrA